jgi:CRP-like cAMP-binding protein
VVTTTSLPRRSTIYATGQRSDCVYLINAGWIKAQTQSEQGKSCLIGLYGPDDVIGDSCLFRGERLETATTLAPTVLTVLPGWLFLRALEQSDLREAWLRYQAERTFVHQESITLLVTADSEYRLAATLLRMAYRFGTAHGDKFHIGYRLTQEELSEIVGTTRSRVGYFLKRFQKLGLIQVARESGIVVNEPRLRDHMSTSLQS